MFPEEDKKELIDVLEVLGGHFKLHNQFFKVGINLVVCSDQCKDKTEFLNKLKDVAADY